MKTNIYLVRHAESESNANPLFDGAIDGLTEKGINQSKTVANYFGNRNISDVFCSDVHRAKLTAEEIAGFLNKEMIVLDFLKERNVAYKNRDDYDYKENNELFGQRLLQAKDFLQNLPEGDFVVVSHAIFLKALVSFLLLGDLFNDELSEEISHHLIIENTSITKFMFNKEKNKWQLDYLNKKLI